MRSIATRRILAPVTVSVALLASAAAGGNFVAGNGNFVTFESGQAHFCWRSGRPFSRLPVPVGPLSVDAKAEPAASV